jgi:sugar-specific transcriptional regulator TrmB
MFDEIVETLTKLGLSEKEIKVYLHCLSKKEGAFTAEITTETGIKRSTVDIVVDKLLDRGFLSYFIDGKRKKYTAEDPKALLYTFENSLGELKKILPFLYTAGAKERNVPKIRFYQGEESVLRMFDDIFLTLRVNGKKEKELLAIASIDDMNNAIGGIQAKVQAKRIQERVSLKIITPQAPLADKLYAESLEDTNTLRSVKFFNPEKYPFRVALNIYDENVSIFNLKENPNGVIIEDADLADSLRSLFFLVWDNLKQ